jgi:hypothetical protein
MTYDPKTPTLPAPCIIDSGIVVNKDDMRRLLNDLGHVHYVHMVDGEVKSSGEGWIVEVFADPHQATIVANHSLYLNILSFDYLELNPCDRQQTYFDLIQDSRLLRLSPLASSLHDPETDRNLDAATLEEMVTQVLSAKWDMQLDEEDDIPL